MPDVSVVVPTYNRASVLERAVSSVLAQSFQDFEIVIVDDASTDDTDSVVRDLDDDRIRYDRFDENRGANAARNRAIELARGRYVSFLDSDDELLPDHLERCVSVLDSSPTECAGAYTSFKMVEDGTVSAVYRAENGPVSRRGILSANVIGGFSCTTFRASVFDDVGLLDEELSAGQDYDFFIRVLDQFDMYGIDEVLAINHLDGERISKSSDHATAGVDRLLEKHGAKLTDSGRSRLYYYLGFVHAEERDFREARRNFLRSAIEWPRRWLAYPHYLASIHPRSFDALLRLKRSLKR